ncbi:hypothetical protein [Xanthocytophaga flava]|nr:hypothetical protein [Xanthocytophaga flavus]
MERKQALCDITILFGYLWLVESNKYFRMKSKSLALLIKKWPDYG